MVLKIFMDIATFIVCAIFQENAFKSLQDIYFQGEFWKGWQSQLYHPIPCIKKSKKEKKLWFTCLIPLWWIPIILFLSPFLLSMHKTELYESEMAIKMYSGVHVGFCFTPNPPKPLTAGRGIQVLWCNLLTEWGPENNITEATDIYGMNHRLYTEVSRHHNTAHNRLYTDPFSYAAKDTAS